MKSGFVPRAGGVLLTAGLLVLSSSTGAYAYIDPGTGSYVLQVVIAGVLAAGFVIKATWRNLKTSVARLFGRRETDAK